MKKIIPAKIYSIVRLRVVSNFGDRDCGAGEIHACARNFEEKQREGSAKN